MLRATAFLDAGGAAPFVPRVLANALRELDRFLSVLIDDVASAARPEGMNHGNFARLRNTPNKLRHIRQALGVACVEPCADHARLRAIGKARDRLFHSAAPSHRPVGLPAWPDTMPPGQGEQGGVQQHAHRVSIAAELLRVCRFYDRLASELVAACDAHMSAH